MIHIVFQYANIVFRQYFICISPYASYLLHIAERIFIADQAGFQLNAGCLKPDAVFPGRVRAVQLGVLPVVWLPGLGVFENL